jgi:Ca-activated chloride channel homolog
MSTLFAQGTQRVGEEFRLSNTPAKCPVFQGGMLFPSSVAMQSSLKNSPEDRLPSSTEEGMLSQGPAGVVAPALRFGDSNGLSNHPGRSRRLLPAPPCPRRGAPFSSLGVPPRGMRGSSESPIPGEVGAERGRAPSAHTGLFPTPTSKTSSEGLTNSAPGALGNFGTVSTRPPKRPLNRVHGLRCSTGAWLAPLLLFLCRAALGQTRDTDRDFKLVVDVNLVSVLATVTTPEGDWVSALKQDDFEIYEDGKRQEIKVFGKESDLPLQLCMLFDSSSSIATELQTQQEAAVQFLTSIIRPVDRVSVLRVSEDVDEVVRASSRLDRLKNAIRSIRPGGGTSLYDAIYLAGEILTSTKGRKVIVAITDGTDTTSHVNLKDCLKQAQVAEAAIYGLVVQPIKSEPGRNLGGEHTMYYLAEKTGGRFFRVLSPDSIRTSFDKISEELRTQYYLGYYPLRGATDPLEFRRIQVRVKDPTHVVRTREGYFPKTH